MRVDIIFIALICYLLGALSGLGWAYANYLRKEGKYENRN